MVKACTMRAFCDPSLILNPVHLDYGSGYP